MRLQYIKLHHNGNAMVHREERIDQELKRLKAVQEAAQYRAEAQASRKMLEHQKSIARVTFCPATFCPQSMLTTVCLATLCLVNANYSLLGNLLYSQCQLVS